MTVRISSSVGLGLSGNGYVEFGISGNRPQVGPGGIVPLYAWALMRFEALLNIAVLLATVRSEQQ